MADPYFGQPFIDEDTWRDTPIRHRYVHGGFSNTETRFAFYFPEPRFYQGRFVQLLGGGAGGTEFGMAPMFLQWIGSLGGYCLESNQGHIGADPGPAASIVTYRANAESARYARELATEMYGWAPHHGYLFGGSGGGMRTINGLENVSDVWAGGAAFVSGDPELLAGGEGPYPGAVVGVLGPKLAQVLDALEPGGGGDPYAGLDAVERESVKALAECNFPLRGLFLFDRPSFHSATVPLFLNAMANADPDFVEMFWTEPGYAGADGELADRVVHVTLTVREVMTSEQLEAAGITGKLDNTGGLRNWVGLRGDSPMPHGALLAAVNIDSGKAAGKELTCFGTFGDLIVVDGQGVPQAAELAIGDKVTVDNRKYLAVCHRHRYKDALPMDKLHLGPVNVAASLIPALGRFHGKMILVDAMLDATIVPAAIRYDRKVREAYGDAAEDRWRLWWADNSDHTGNAGPSGPAPVLKARLVNYFGMARQALIDVIDWVERGIAPAPSTAYRIEGGQLELPSTAAERGGLQPVVTATANGKSRAEISGGEEVTFEVLAEAPPGGGTIHKVEWDFEGGGAFADVHDEVDGSSTSVRLTRNHRFGANGTYYPAVRVVAHRPESAEFAAHDELLLGALEVTSGFENLARVRVIVR